MDTALKFTEILVNVAKFCAKAGEAFIAWMIFVWGWNHIRPVIKRLGMGLRKRKIYIIADDQNAKIKYEEVEKLIKSSGLFDENNIQPPVVPGDLDQAELNLRDFLKGKSLLIYIYSGSTVKGDERLENVLRNKEETAGLIVLAPPNSIPVVKGDPNCLMAKVSDCPNTVVVNAQGRMLNDLWNLMMTTDFQKKGFWATLLDG